MIVIYTADVKRGSTKPDIDLGAMKLHLEEGFLSGLDGDQICREIRRKLDQKLLLTEEDAMRLMILPLTYPVFRFFFLYPPVSEQLLTHRYSKKDAKNGSSKREA